MRSDLDVVSSLAPDLVILDIGTNDLATSGPEVVAGSSIEELVNLLLDTYSVRAEAYNPEAIRSVAKQQRGLLSDWLFAFLVFSLPAAAARQK